MQVKSCLLIVLTAALASGAYAASHLDKQTLHRLVQLETKYFDHTYDTDTDDQRTQRLEKMIFGSEVAGDPGQRINNLVAAVGAQTLDPPPPPAPATASGANTKSHARTTVQPTQEEDDTAQSDHDTGVSPAGVRDYPRIDAMEQAILGKTFLGQPLPDRLARMEQKAFSKVQSDKDLSERADALEKYVEKTLHKKLFDGSNQTEAAAAPNSQQGSGSKILTMVGKSLLGMAGVNLTNANAPNNNSTSSGFMSPFGGSGFGGRGMRGQQRQQQQQQQQAEKQATAHTEDPAVHATTPPPSSAKLIVKVGWCEVQTFGQTFPEMHLPGRLQQLNRQLNFEPGKTDLELMDHINALMKAVQSRNEAFVPTKRLAQ